MLDFDMARMAAALFGGWLVLAREYWMFIPVVLILVSIRPVVLKVHSFFRGGV